MKTDLFSVSVFLLPLLFSCSYGVATIDLDSSGTEMPAEYVVIAQRSDGSYDRFDCPASTDEIKCGLEKVMIRKNSGIESIFLKIRKFRFEKVGNISDSVILLKSVVPFENNDDFVKGFKNTDDELFDSFSVDFDTELGKTGVLKFYVKNAYQETPEVYFQNTTRHQIHYDFATNFADEDLSASEFTKEVYVNSDRTRFAGSVIYYEGVENSPYALTFFPGDTASPEQISMVFRMIEERLLFTNITGDEKRLVYLPAGESQEVTASKNPEIFESMDIPVLTREMLYSSIPFQLLNEGKACGTLKKMSPDDLGITPVSFKDVLILTRLPNELPVVGGTITEEFQTPLAHVNVAARNRGTPNIALPEASENTKIKPFIGKLVEFIVQDGTYSIKGISQSQAEKCWEELKKEPFIPQYDIDSDGLPLFSEIKFEDSVKTGVKAANLAVLSQVLPENTPAGFAVPFHYYNEFINSKTVTAEIVQKAETDCTDEGRTAEICSETTVFLTADTPETIADLIKRMLSDSRFTRDTVFREAVLNALKYIIYRTPVDETFATELNSRITEVFGTEKVRLRSSTNAEDLEQFSGAGLYDSTSAYASGEDAASLKITKVWSSIWNFEAFEEREFWGIDHSAVFMGVCVSSAFEDESSNGVIITRNIADPAIAGMYVNVQPGEASVTNPEDGGLPEVFIITESFGGNVETMQIRYSSLSPDTSVLSNDQVKALYKAAMKAHSHFSDLYGINEAAAAFDIEFKFDSFSVLMLKQIRPYSSGE